MTEENAAVETVAPETTTTAPEAVVSSQEQSNPAPERDYEKEARDMGWVPEAEFRGPKDKWKAAQQFVEDGETILPLVRAENKRLKDKFEQQEKDYAARFERLNKASKATIEAMKRQHSEKLAELTARRDAAVEAGDVKTFRAIDKQITDHAASAPQVDDVEEKPKADDNDAVMAEWRKTNAWYETDDVMTEAAIGISQNILRKNPGISLAENLRLTDAAMKERFPLKFGGTTGANGHAPVDGGGDPKVPAPKKDTLTSKLPPEALAQAKADVAAGVYKTTEEWAKVYYS